MVAWVHPLVHQEEASCRAYHIDPLDRAAFVVVSGVHKDSVALDTLAFAFEAAGVVVASYLAVVSFVLLHVPA